MPLGEGGERKKLDPQGPYHESVLPWLLVHLSGKRNRKMRVDTAKGTSGVRVERREQSGGSAKKVG